MVLLDLSLFVVYFVFSGLAAFFGCFFLFLFCGEYLTLLAFTSWFVYFPFLLFFGAFCFLNIFG